MAEVAAGLIVAEQVVSTTVEGGALAGYALSRPTMPLKASLTQIGKSDDPALALARSHLSLTIIGQKAYIFGGETAEGQLASSDIHAVTLPSSDKVDADYACVPSVPLNEGGRVPAARARHAACARGHHIVLFGGCDAEGAPINEGACLWLWDSQMLKWAEIGSTTEASKEDVATAQPEPRFDHRLFADSTQDTLILYGGRASRSGEALLDTWLFDFKSQLWTRLPDGPVSGHEAAFADGTLYVITGETDVSGEVHSLAISSPSAESKAVVTGWETHTFPTSPLAPGPRPREGASLAAVSTGYGRLYLLYTFGCRPAKPHADSTADGKEATDHEAFYSDMWTYQLPSLSAKPTTWTDLKPAVLKDTIRQKLGFDSGGHTWGEVEVQATEQTSHEGKVHPGPRGFFGADVGADGKSLVLWGGINARGERESDGWMVQLQS